MYKKLLLALVFAFTTFLGVTTAASAQIPQCTAGQVFQPGECSCVCDGNGPPGSPVTTRTCIDPKGACSDTDSVQNPAEMLDQQTIDNLNPLKIPEFQTGENVGDLSTPRGILNRVLQFAFPLAGLILFVMLVWSGLEIVVGATEKKSLDAGRQRATAAVIGFVLLFVSYWIIQILEIIFNLSIL